VKVQRLQPVLLIALLSIGNVVHAQPDATNAEPLPAIYIAGDSTAADGAEGARGWGRHLARFFDPATVRVENRARGGRSSRTFVTEGLWDDLASGLHANDIVLIQFGHNDGGAINDPERARGSLPGLGDETVAIDNLKTGQPETVHSFGWYMRKMIRETQERGAIPVLVSLTVRNIWNDGRVERGSGRYSEWTRELALSEQLAFIDLTRLVADDYERLGEAAVAELFPRDHTHTSDEGALRNATLLMQGLLGLREERWRSWLSTAGRSIAHASPAYVSMPTVRRGTDAASEQRFLNTPQKLVEDLPTLWLIGDSTVRTGRGRGENGQFGWGDPLQIGFDLNRINVVNCALGGTGARTFRTGGYWQPVLEQLEPNDVVLIQFGHNDNGERGALPGTGPETESRTLADGATEIVETFGSYLRHFAAEIRARNATPVILSLIPRNIWKDGRIVRSNDGHQAWARQIAEQEGIAFIDLYECIAARYDKMGPDAVDAMFADERVHTTYDGARLNAECVSMNLTRLSGPVAQLISSATRPHSDDATAGAGL